jgi:hypothetical protein
MNVDWAIKNTPPLRALCAFLTALVHRLCQKKNENEKQNENELKACFTNETRGRNEIFST